MPHIAGGALSQDRLEGATHSIKSAALSGRALESVAPNGVVRRLPSARIKIATRSW